MKTISFLLLAITSLFGFSACGDNDDNAQNQDEQIVGVWKLTRITGGFSGQGYPADFTDVEFKNNGTYRINNQDEAKGEGTYSLDSLENHNGLVLQLFPSDSIKIGFEEYAKDVVFDKENLILSDPCCDLFQYEFGPDGN